MSEEILQKTWVNLVKILYPDLLISLSLSGITLPGSAKVKSQIISGLKSAGFVRGLPDLLVYCPNGVVVNLEFKRPTGGIQSDDQKTIQAQLLSLDHNYYLVNSIQLAFDKLALHLDTSYRESAYDSIISQYKPTEQFLTYPVGTPLDIIKPQLKQFYCL